jgi:putative endonuclease
MLSQRKIGGIAEQLARDYLEKEGMQIIDTNWYYGHLELDIIALDENELVIVEVKSRNGIRFEHPSDAINNIKIKRIIEAADAYINEKRIDFETRFDLITIIFAGSEFELEHFKNAFFPTM